MGASDVRGRTGEVQDANIGDLWRKRLPRAVHAIAGIVQRAAAAGSAVETGRISRRRALDPETAERAILVQDVFGLAGGVHEIVDQLCQEGRSGAAPLQKIHAAKRRSKARRAKRKRW